MEICISLNVKQYPCLHGVLSICIRGNSLSILSLIRQKQQGGEKLRWITTERVLAGLSCEGESPGGLWNEWLDWGLFSWLLWSGWSFLRKDWEHSTFSWTAVQGKLPVKLNRKSQYISHNVFFGRFLSKHMRNYHLLWCGDDSLFREALIINLTKLHFSPSSFCFLHVSVAQFVSSVMKSTRGQPQRQNTGRCKNNSSWFNLCKGKHYFLVICFLQLLPQTDATA